MDKKYRLEYLPAAQNDLMSIVEYIQVDDPLSAMNLIDVVDKSISKLAYFPYLGVIPKDIRLMHLDYRVLIIDNYLVFYVVLEEVVEIRRILHGKRQYSFLL